MDFTRFELPDLLNLSELQPPDWGDLAPRFEYFIKSGYCKPIKLSENGQMIGIGSNMFHQDSVWLACIVVHPDHRGRGLGTILTQKLLADIDRGKYSTIYLDATDFGYPVYKKLGFEVEADYVHLNKQLDSEPYPISKNIVPFREALADSLLKLDEEISGERREGILSDFFQSALVYLVGEEVHGFYIPDWGDGPVIAKNNEAGLELMKLRIQEKTSAVIPAANKSALAFLEKNGFGIYKMSRRMLLGQPKNWKPTRSFNWISGQLG